MKKKGLVGAIAMAVLIFGGLILTLLCTSRVPAGYVGVVYNMNGGVDGEVLSQGWHVVSPTKNVTLYSIGIEQSYLTSDEKGDSKNDESFSIPTSDGKTVRVNLEFSYRFDPDRVSSTFTTFKGKSGEEIKDTFIKPKIIAWTQEVSANYPVTDIFGDQRTAINAELDTYLKEKFDVYGIIIDTVNFTDIAPSSFQSAMERNTKLSLDMLIPISQTLDIPIDNLTKAGNIPTPQRRRSMRLDTKRNIGNAGLSMAIAYFGANGYTVSVPLNDTQDYDLIVDMDGTLKKIQVKATDHKESKDSYTVQLRTVSGTTRKAYKTVVDTDIDFLFCLCGDGTMFLIPKVEINNRSAVRLGTEKSKFSRKDSPDYSKFIVKM